MTEITKGKWLQRIRNYKPQKRSINLREYHALYKQAEFKCPLHRKGDRMTFCDGHDCPTNMKTLDTYEAECRRARRYLALILMIQMGWLRVETS